MAAKAGSTASPTPNPAPPGHNQGPLSQEDLDDLFLVHLAQARKDHDTLETAMEAVRAVKKQRTRNRTLCRTDGFPLKQLDEILEDELLPVSEIREREEKRARMRGLASQPGGSLEQIDLFSDSFAQKEKDSADYRSHGYTTGLRGGDGAPSQNDVPAEFQQVWMEGWHDGQARLAKAWTTKQRIEGVLPLPATPVEGVKLEGAADIVEATAAEPVAAEVAPAAEEVPGEAAAVEVGAEDDPINEPCPDCGAAAGELCAADCPSAVSAEVEPA